MHMPLDPPPPYSLDESRLDLLFSAWPAEDVLIRAPGDEKCVPVRGLADRIIVQDSLGVEAPKTVLKVREDGPGEEDDEVRMFKGRFRVVGVEAANGIKTLILEATAPSGQFPSPDHPLPPPTTPYPLQGRGMEGDGREFPSSGGVAHSAGVVA